MVKKLSFFHPAVRVCGRQFLPLLGLLLLSACQPVGKLLQYPSSQESQQLEQALYNIPVNNLPITAKDFLAVDKDMQFFIDSYVRKRSTPSRRLNRLVRNLINKSVVGVEYDAGAHFTASGAFHNSRANCLSFSALVIALGQELDLDVRFQEVDLPPSWQLGDENLLLQFRHVNVLAQLEGGHKKVVDFRLERFSHFYPSRIISAKQALALHFNNLAIEAMLAKQWPKVFSYLKQALQADSSSSIAWGNLGLAYKRTGQYQLADIAYRTSLELDPYDYSVVNNLSKLYREMGRIELADNLKDLSSKYRSRNPYYHYAKARLAYSEKQFTKALSFIDKALARDGDEGNFLQFKAHTLRKLKQPEKAIAMLQRAARIEPFEPEKALLRKMMADWRKEFNLPAQAD